jgi:lipoprotein-anchoring transpeptidase ErfK/SrfK
MQGTGGVALLRESFSIWAAVGLCALMVGACGADNTEAESDRTADAYWDLSEEWTREELERGRHDASWRQVVRIDTVADTLVVGNIEEWEDISAETLTGWPMRLPLGGEVAGPSVLRVQVLLDRALFSPGVMDGRWGKNTEKAVYWLQHREGLRTTGMVDDATFRRLVELAGRPETLVREHRLTEEEVAGPFVRIPSDIYEHARLDCSCYESLEEKLGELFHVHVDVLRRLNPGVELGSVGVGQVIRVPAVREADAGRGARIDRLVVSRRGHYVHALDAGGRILLHFPSTLGSSYDPSPTGDYRVTRIVEDPWWHYQPAILAHRPDHEPDARIPPGPNNAVGVVWMALSKPHYGIHGTPRPETIGYASSAGCVRLTNWDALFLARRLEEGAPVEFRDT